MDLGIARRSAIVCGASAGLGRGIATALAREGVNVFAAARGEERLNAAAKDIARDTGGTIKAVVADVTTEDGRATVLAACPQPDILVNNAGGPPPGDFRNWSRDEWIKTIDANMIERRFGRIVNITSHMVKQPIGILGLSNGARAGLTGFSGGLARDVARYNVTINNMLPGQFDTDRLQSNHQKFAAARNVPLKQFQDEAREQVPAKRFGTPAEFGAAGAFLCSAHAGYITGQNLLLDRGQYPGLM